MTDWKLGQFVRVWRSNGDDGGYEYGHIHTIDHGSLLEPKADVMLVGDDGREIFCRVKDLEEG